MCNTLNPSFASHVTLYCGNSILFMSITCTYYLHCQLVVKPVQQNKGVEERNRRDIEAEERRVNPEVSLASKTQQVARLLGSLVLPPSPQT